MPSIDTILICLATLAVPILSIWARVNITTENDFIQIKNRALSVAKEATWRIFVYGFFIFVFWDVRRQKIDLMTSDNGVTKEFVSELSKLEAYSILIFIFLITMLLLDTTLWWTKRKAQKDEVDIEKLKNV